MNIIRKRWAPVLFVLFFAVLSAVTLFSKTLQTMALPKVITEKPVSRTLTHVIQGNGEVVPNQEDDLVSESGWKIKTINVKLGDAVKQGQILATFDGTELEQTLLDEEAVLQKRLLERESLQEQFKIASRNSDAEAILQAKRDLERDQWDEAVARRKVDGLRRELQQKTALTAPYAGIVTDIYVREGIAAPLGQKILTLMSPAEGFQFSFAVDANAAALLELGEEFPVTIRGGRKGVVNGTVSEIKEASSLNESASEGDGRANRSAKEKKVVISLPNGDLQGGEQASIQIEKPSALEGVVLRKDYIKKDGKGSYVFIVQENKSSLGNNYYARKTYIQIVDENDEEVLAQGINEQADVIAEYSEPLQDGHQVRL